MEDYQIRQADRNDLTTIYNMIHCLARYEKREEDAVLSKEDLNYWLFEKNAAKVLLLEKNTKPIGYALYYPVFASFAAQAHIHLEDMYILPSFRHQGLGRYFMENIASLMIQEGYSAMEWSALAWNEQAASFYLSIGAKKETSRIYFNLDNFQMKLLSQKFVQIHRIQEMEEAMERLSAALSAGHLDTPESAADYQKLDTYYQNEWKQDYEADERNELPAALKRGVLSEDGLYDLLCEADERRHQ